MKRLLALCVLAGFAIAYTSGCDESMKPWADRPWKKKVRIDGGELQHNWREALHNDRDHVAELDQELGRWWNLERTRWPTYETVESDGAIDPEVTSAHALSGSSFVR